MSLLLTQPLDLAFFLNDVKITFSQYSNSQLSVVDALSQEVTVNQ